MPRIQEVMDEAGNSEGTSLQVSSTSPEVIQNMGRALQVRETLVMLVGLPVHRHLDVHCKIPQDNLLSCR